MVNNKAHTATLNRICQKYGVQPGTGDPFDIQTQDMIIEVETSASISDGVARLQNASMPAYIAVTNKEGMKYAESIVRETSIGLMDPKGNIVVPSRNNIPDSVTVLES